MIDGGLEARRRRRVRLLRRLGVLGGATLIASAVVLANSIVVSSDGHQELLNGQGDSQSLLLPLLLFVLGMLALALSLPGRRPG